MYECNCGFPKDLSLPDPDSGSIDTAWNHERFIEELLRSHNNHSSTHSTAPSQLSFLHYVFHADLVITAVSGIEPPHQYLNLPELESVHIMLAGILTDHLTCNIN